MKSTKLYRWCGLLVGSLFAFQLGGCNITDALLTGATLTFLSRLFTTA